MYPAINHTSLSLYAYIRIAIVLSMNLLPVTVNCLKARPMWFVTRRHVHGVSHTPLRGVNTPTFAQHILITPNISQWRC